jgi:hypothetical protein
MKRGAKKKKVDYESTVRYKFIRLLALVLAGLHVWYVMTAPISFAMLPIFVLGVFYFLHGVNRLDWLEYIPILRAFV